jgi:hypothetical protein
MLLSNVSVYLLGCTVSQSTRPQYESVMGLEIQRILLPESIKKSYDQKKSTIHNCSYFIISRLQVRVQKTASRYGTRPPTRGGPPAEGLGVWLTSHHKKVIGKEAEVVPVLN